MKLSGPSLQMCPDIILIGWIILSIISKILSKWHSKNVGREILRSFLFIFRGAGVRLRAADRQGTIILVKNHWFHRPLLLQDYL